MRLRLLLAVEFKFHLHSHPCGYGHSSEEQKSVMLNRCVGMMLGAAMLLASSMTPSALAAESAQLQELRGKLATSTGLPRRQAARQILALGAEANDVVLSLLADQDLVVRRNAHRNLRARFGDQALAYYEKGLQDAEAMVRIVVVEDLIAWQPRTEQVVALLQKATKDSDNEVRKLAADAFWDFHRDYLTLRKRPQWDHNIEVKQQQELPTTGWRFMTDPGRNGHVEKWFAPDFDDSAWHAATIGKWWHEALPDTVGHYEGVAWYRFDFTAPPAPDYEYNEAVLHFHAVDESTWVWVNGQYAGELDIGTAGWNVPFDIEIGSFLNWGGKNKIAVRVLNAAGAGGIYKPVEFQVLK